MHHGNHEQVQHKQHADHDVGDHPEPRLLACGDRQNAESSDCRLQVVDTVSMISTSEDSRRARELFARKVLGTSPATDATGVLVSSAGTRVAVEISSVPLMSCERVVGVFGLFEGRPADRPTRPHPHLTPRQVEVLRLLEQGRSTKQIAAELHLSTETIRNHIRHLFRALGVNSRLEADAAARAVSPY
jgi:DNA-binding NarL/FixJ family response regulator